MAKRKKSDLSHWYHATLLSPIKQTVIQAIKKFYFATWTNLTINIINKLLLPIMATAKVHMNQTRTKIDSTNQQDLMKLGEPPMKILAQLTNTFFTNITNHKRQIST